MGFESVCDTELNLGFGLNHPSIVQTKNTESFEPSLTLSLSANHDDFSNKVVAVERYHAGLIRQESVISGGGSSSASVKREREMVNEESERVLNNYSYSKTSLSGGDDGEDDDGSVNGRKKLRLTKPQSALLEEAFKLHSTLNPKQKQELARELKLRPRQVEVWFQNRRARSKLKQTEVDCEYLKKCCETLTDENRRLHKEVQELKAMKVPPQPLYMQLPAPRLTMCPSCERVGDTGSATKSPFNMAPKPHLFNPFTNPSAAC